MFSFLLLCVSLKWLQRVYITLWIENPVKLFSFRKIMIRWQRMRSRRKREKRRSWRRRHDITFCSANVCGRLRSLSRSVLPFGGALRAPSSAAGTFCRSQGSLILEWDFGHGSRYRAWPIFLCPWPDFCLLWEPCSFLWGEEQSEKKKKKKRFMWRWKWFIKLWESSQSLLY